MTNFLRAKPDLLAVCLQQLGGKAFICRLDIVSTGLLKYRRKVSEMKTRLRICL